MKPRLFVLLVSAAAVLVSCSPTPEYLKKKNIALTSSHKDVRVLLLKTKEKVSISSESKTRIKDFKTGRVVSDSPKLQMEFTPDKLESPLLIESWDSPLSVNGTAYRGDIELHNVLGVINVINFVAMNDYLKGVVPCETPSSWPIESLKAQAVAARTYCYYHMSYGSQNLLYNLDATTRSQVYKGIPVETSAASKAVDETNGIIITDNGKPIIAYFHSTCGGRTIDDKYVWSGNGADYLKGIECGYCGESPHFSWEQKLSLDEISKVVKTKYKNIDKITKISFIKKDGRVVEVKLAYKSGSTRMSGNEFRLMFPPSQAIKSLYFVSEKNGNGLLLKGHGWGHGVGMCQWGAKGMADAGLNYKDIVSHYYSRIKVVKISEVPAGKRAALSL